MKVFASRSVALPVVSKILPFESNVFQELHSAFPLRSREVLVETHEVAEQTQVGLVEVQRVPVVLHGCPFGLKVLVATN